MSLQVRRWIEEGVRLFPEDMNFVVPVAELYEREGLRGDAIFLAKQGLRFSTDPNAQNRLEAVLVRLSAAGRHVDGAAGGVN